MMCAATIEASVSVKVQQAYLGLSPAAKLYRVDVGVALAVVHIMTASTAIA